VSLNVSVTRIIEWMKEKVCLDDMYRVIDKKVPPKHLNMMGISTNFN